VPSKEFEHKPALMHTEFIKNINGGRNRILKEELESKGRVRADKGKENKKDRSRIEKKKLARGCA
jgi:hypothetical protein